MGTTKKICRLLKTNQEPPASFKAPDQDLKDMEVLCTFKIDSEIQKSHQGLTNCIQIMIIIQKPNQQLP